MTNLICKVPFCENTIAKKSYVYCWIHRAEREKYKAKKMEFVMPLWAVKNCKIHGYLKKRETIDCFSNPSGINSPKCKKCKNEKRPYCPIKMKVFNDANKEKRRHQMLLRNFKLSLEQFNAMAISQNHLCAICKKPQCKFDKKSKKVRSLAVDHNHKTGKIRELLCTSCNTAIGLFEENSDLIQEAINYLRRHETA